MTATRHTTAPRVSSARKRTLATLAACLAAAPLWLAGTTAATAQSEEVIEETVSVRPRLDYESYGLSLDPVDRGARSTGASPVYAFTRLEVEAGHDSNVRRAATGEDSSLFSVTRPGLSLHVDGEIHQTSLTGQAAVGRYRSSGDDYEDLELDARSRIEVDEDSNLILSGKAARSHVARGSDLDLGPAFGVQTYSTYSTRAEFETAGFNDNLLTGFADSTWQRYDDAEGVDRSALDRWVGTARTRVGFARTGTVSYFLQPGAERVVYQQATTGNPDSTRLDLALGATYQGGSVSLLTGYAGISRRSYDDGGTDAELAALAGVDLLWNATDLMTVTGKLSIANEDTELSTASSVTTSTLGIGIDYEIRDDIIGGFDIGWTDKRYQGDVEDERVLQTGVDVRYLLNEYAYVGAGLRWEDQVSDDPSSEYRATIASLRLGAKLCCLRDIVSDTPQGRQIRQGVVRDVFR